MTSLHECYGWRVWRVRKGTLISPYTSRRRVTLPSSGTIEDEHGIYYYPASIRAENMRAKMLLFDDLAVTFGVALGWVAPDDGMEKVLRAKRTDRFRVRMIFADQHADELKSNHPNVPVWSLDKMVKYQRVVNRVVKA
jgi:hypothetical protein